jgi:hypothetical protein
MPEVMRTRSSTVISRFCGSKASSFLPADLRVLELGQIAADGRREIELALFDQHHGGDAGDVLRHRGHPEDRIGLQRNLFGTVLESDRLQIGELALTRDRGQGAGIDLRLVPGRNPREPARGKAETARVALCRDGKGRHLSASGREDEDERKR